MPDLPAGTVTFLFADIEGSTRLLQWLGNDYPAVIAEYRRVLRSALGTQGGRELNTWGDAIFAAFSKPRDAVTTAVGAQRALAAHPWPGGIRAAPRR